MMGYSMAFASFYVVEVMSSSIFASKRIGYLAAAQSFSPTTDVLLLTTNQFKKDLTNGKLQDCSQALTCLAKLVTEELGRDLERDVSLLLNSPRPYIRKKALLVLYRLIMVHPDTLPVVSARFRDCLTDSDPGVVCAAVTVTCELARAAPRSFLSLAPILYQLLTNRDSNNWMLIKIVKLMGVLTPLEPRLGKKLVEPLTTLMRTTRAKSLLYECCSCITAGLLAYPEAVELCALRLVEFMDESDQNLKYLGLLSMKKLINAHPHLAMEHRDNILDCLDDEDPGIRMRALELVSEFVTRRTLRDISRILLKKLRKASGDFATVEAEAATRVVDMNPQQAALTDQEASYRESLAGELLRAGVYTRSSDPAKAGYEFLRTGDDFAWYTTSVLGGLSDIPLLSVQTRNSIGDQLLELTSRVEALRPISVNVALSLLTARRNSSVQPSPLSTPAQEQDMSQEADGENIQNEEEEGAKKDSRANGKTPVTEQIGSDAHHGEAILPASLAGSTAWILGEYSELIGNHLQAAKALVCFPHKGLDSSAQVRVLTACVKVYASSSNSEADEIYKLLNAYIESLIGSQYAEVQERAWLFRSLLESVTPPDRENLGPLFEGKLVPVDHRAQLKVPVASDLDLEQPLLDTGSDSLYSYLEKTIGTGEVDEDEVTDDNDSLFKEAVFANSTLSFSSDQLGAESSLTGNSHDRGTFLASLPSTGNNTQSPFYLGGPSGVGSSTDRDADNTRTSERIAPKFKYDPSQLPSEAATVLVEERPVGLVFSDEENEINSTEAPKGNERLETAFANAFEGAGIASRQASQAEGRRKKKKKRKEGKEKKGRTINKTNQPSGKETQIMSNLIDLDMPPNPPNTAEGSASSSKPKHLADAFLI